MGGRGQKMREITDKIKKERNERGGDVRERRKRGGSSGGWGG